MSEKDSSWIYHLVFPSTGDLPGPKWTVRDDQLVADAQQASAGTPLSPRINAEWTFHPRHAGDTTQISLPLRVVRFAPPVDELR